MFIYDFIKIILDIIISFSLSFGVILLYRYFRNQKFYNNEKRKRYTLDLCISDKRVYEKLLSRGKTPYYKQIENREDIIDYFEVNEALSYFEKICIGISTRIYDEEVIKLYYGKYFLLFYDYYKYYILKYRNKNKAPFLFLEYEKYARKWKDNIHDYETITKRRYSDEW